MSFAILSHGPSPPADLVCNLSEGELVDLIEEFSDGRIQFAFVKVKDPNTGLPKNVLIAWVCSALRPVRIYS